MSMHPLAEYLLACRSRRNTGALTPETSLYGPLETLLTLAGAELHPVVHTFMSLKNRAGTMPDGGLFTADQIGEDAVEAPEGTVPKHGVVECKPPSDEVLKIADSAQVSKYWDKYNQVLVTNYREFLLLGRDDAGNRVRYEHYRLVRTEAEFWTTDASELAESLGDEFLDFLRRCLLRRAPITDPESVAWFLASYAREARGRIARASSVPALESVRRALEQALGIDFEDTAKPEEGRRFFRSTLVQTLFYGVFSAWVLWHRSRPKEKDKFDWEKSAKFLRVPVLRKLFHELADPGKLEEWKLDEVLNWAGETLNRVERIAFFSKFQDSEAVQYFYEPFLQAFDPELRKQLGVWYTPPEIVKYMVARVDRTLKEELGRPDGLADDNVYVLDPCCGTGAYIVEVLRAIDVHLIENEDGNTRALKLKRAVKERVFGFELLPAPFVVAHLQIGLYLQEIDAAFDQKEDRAAIYLTNALTGWDPLKDPKPGIFDELNDERALATGVKRQKPILVVLGNPPYNGFAGVKIGEEGEIANAYRWAPGEPADLKPQGQGLNDLYIRFFRMAERCITGRKDAEGIVCFISNYSWLDGLSFPLMRQRYLESFDSVWIDSLNGDKYKTGKVTPAGKPDPSAFSTARSREGIQVGTAIALMVRKKAHKSPAKIHFRDFWGKDKLKELVAFGTEWAAKKYQKIKPDRALGLPFRPMKTTEGYTKWPRIPELFPTNFPGVQTGRDDVLIDIDRAALEVRMLQYFDLEIPHRAMARIAPRVMMDSARYKAIPVRDELRKRGYLPDKIVRFAYRPFDIRWLYWEPETKLLDEKRPDYFPHVFSGNSWLAAVQQNRKEFDPALYNSGLACRHIIERGANVFPLLLREETNGHSLFGDDAGRKCHQFGDHCANVSDAALDYLNLHGGIESVADLFFHAIAITHAPQFAVENGDALRQDWPRIPLSKAIGQLKLSGALGKKLSALLDPESPVLGVTTGKRPSEIRSIALMMNAKGGQLAESDLAVAARWGVSGQGGACMPGPGKAVERALTPDERAALGEGLAHLGETTFDIYLNDRAYWQNVPAKVWTYTLGGYQVLKKWLSYRERAILGRALKLDEVDYFRDVVRRIAAIRLLGPELDANYRAAKADLHDWPS